MKNILAILTVIALLVSWPLAAMAGGAVDDPEMHDRNGPQGIAVPDQPHTQDDIECDQQDTGGDPHNLGGGFRGTTSPSGYPPVPVWFGPVVTLIIKMV